VYANVRAAFIRAPADDKSAIDAANARTSALQTAIWGDVAALTRERADPVAASLMSAVNDTFDSSTSERFAFAFNLPPQLFALLGGMALLGMAALGFQLGLRRNAHRFLAVLLTALWTVVVVQIFDLASPRLGVLRTGTAVYDWTIQGFQGGLQIPQLPSPK
jgi:predicted benzoate:H+ symporter BenE